MTTWNCEKKKNRLLLLAYTETEEPFPVPNKPDSKMPIP